MAKLSTFCCVLFLLAISCGGEMVLMIEAKQFKVEGVNRCDITWPCQGDDRCRADCKKKYKGDGLCDTSTSPYVPRKCFCAYPC
ncbi:hypothetical protein SO802_008413 [Lithocarpus litseifolius]|uniref:Uncharacterized protein n=1 Tax=Lithocarpus litseifolius TaxID=425828 RepID=A0AAW2D979_9ROSI